MNDDYNFNKDEIELFNEIQKLNYLMQRVSQISWHYNQFNKRYGLANNLSVEQYAHVLRSLASFLEQVVEIADDFEHKKQS